MLTNLRKMNLLQPRYYDVPRVKVESGKALTPSDIHEMTKHGIPASSQQLNPELFDDGNLSREMSIDKLFRRGVTANELWEDQKNARSRLRKAYDSQALTD